MCSVGNQITGLLLVVLSGVSASSGGTPEKLEIQNGLIKVTLEKVAGRYEESYFVKAGKGWELLLVSGSALRTDPALRQNGSDVPVGFSDASVVKRSGGEQVVELKALVGQSNLVRTIGMREGEPFVRVNMTYRIVGAARIGHLLSTYSFLPDGKKYDEYRPLDFVFTPQLRPEREHVIADHTFRSPAFMMQEGTRFAALVPDVPTIDIKDRAIKSMGDVQVGSTESPLLSYGLQNWYPEPYRRRDTHVYYVAPDSLESVVSDMTVAFGYLLFLRGDAPVRQGFREVVRYHWNKTGSENLMHSRGPQAEPFSSYIRKAWYQFVPQVVLDAELNGKPVTLLRQARLAWSNKLHAAADNDCWFNVWFNALRTAYGMYLHGRTVDDARLQEQAERVLNLALLAPQRGGFAPSIFYLDSAGGHWVADHAWGGISNGEYLAMFHNAWTCYWLLRWTDLLPARRGEILSYTRSFADALVSQQRATGVIPSWYHPETLEPAETFRDENAETGGAALFLAEFYKRTREKKYLEAAERCMAYIFTSILLERKWFDFETFFSCSRKPLGFFDAYTQQHPQNTLSMHQAAEACYELYGISKKPLYRDRGVEILDYLCLYQQVWSPKWLSCELFGGFGVQNTDAEWSDSRQGYFAVTLMNYYELTGKREYFERGVAALRAMFSLFESPSSPRTAENYAHSAFDQLAGVTGLHWGTGSSVVSIHLITHRYGDAYVNVRDGWGAGIDGCRIPSVKVKDSAIDVRILDNLPSPRTVRVKFDKLARPEYNVTVNGKAFGDISSTRLRRGINVAL